MRVVKLEPVRDGNHLAMAGSLKRANPPLVEDGVLNRAMRDANVPQFLKDDLPLFAEFKLR